MLRNINESQLASAFSQDFSHDLPGEDCPSAEELWMACTLELDLEARQRIIDHCIECPHCAQELRLTREMVTEHNEFMVGAPANTLSPAVAKLCLAESDPVASLRIVSEAPAEPANDLAQQAQGSKVVSLGAWRSKLSKLTAAGGVLAVAAALALIVVKQDESPKRSVGPWRGDDAQSQGGNHRFSKKTFSWPAQTGVERYELELHAGGSKCVQTVATNQFAFEPSACPNIDISRPFFWRVRPLSEQGQGKFSRYFSVQEP